MKYERRSIERFYSPNQSTWQRAIHYIIVFEMQNLSIHFSYNKLLVSMGPKIDGQHDVDDLCRNNYLINVKLLFAYIFAHHLKYWILQLFWFVKYNVHICSNGGLYHTVKVGIWYILNIRYKYKYHVYRYNVYDSCLYVLQEDKPTIWNKISKRLNI